VREELAAYITGADEFSRLQSTVLPFDCPTTINSVPPVTFRGNMLADVLAAVGTTRTRKSLVHGSVHTAWQGGVLLPLHEHSLEGEASAAKKAAQAKKAAVQGLARGQTRIL
jgi:hypothetical protein